MIFCQHTGTTSAAVANRVKPSAKPVEGSDAPSKSTLERHLHGVAIDHRTEINQRSMNSCYWNPQHEGDVSVGHVPRAMNNDIGAMAADIDQRSHLDQTIWDIV
jgi:hypothetical protein